MTNPIPADAVREALDYLMLFGPNKSARDTIEAHIAALTARVSYLESAWQVETLARKDAVIAAQECDNDELKARLAALAGAGPVAYVRWSPRHGYAWGTIHLRDAEVVNGDWRSVPLFTHAPAKAREVICDKDLLAQAVELRLVITDAIKIHSSFNTTADMADWLRDAIKDQP